MTAPASGSAAGSAPSSASPGAILRVDDLGVSLEVAPGETLALVGESGSGKSTVALAAMGLLSGNATARGRVVVDGTDVVAESEKILRSLRGSTVSMVFQEPATALDPLTRIGAQIAEVIRNHRDVSKSAAWQEAVSLLERVGIPDPASRARVFPFQLSGGQRQRVVIAMAIANEPRLLIADEPTTALDVTVQAEILELLRRLAVDTGTGVLLVTHNMGVVADFADRVAVMYQGGIVETGGVEEVLLTPTHEYTRQLLAAVPRLATESPTATAGAVAPGPAAPGTAAPGPAAPGPAAPGAVAPLAAEPATGDRVISLDGVSVRFGRGTRSVLALDDITVDVHAGETVGLVGESGSGKSTAARVALGLIAPTSGRVELFGKDFRRIGVSARRSLQAGIGVVLQDPVASLDARMNVGEIIAEPLRIHRRDVAGRERDRLVADALEAVRLPAALAGRAPRELSGGQRQRISLARALVLKPKLLVADEPTSALDVSVQKAVLEVIGELQAELGFACLFVSHDLAVVQEFCSRVVVMRAGLIEEQGTTGETLVHPTTDYTRRLLAAVPVPDPVVQRRRRAARLEALAQVGE